MGADVASKFRILDKWQRRPGDNFEYRKVRKGWDTIGEIRKYPSGHIIYWAKRKPDDIFTKTNAWAFDVETIVALKASVWRGYMTATASPVAPYIPFRTQPRQ